MAHVDGGSRGNPGPAGSGVILTADDGTPLFEGGFFLGRATNNVAEYRGLLEALRAANRLGATELCVVSDSELLVRQMNGQYKVRNEGLLPLFEEARRLARQFKECSYRHVRRELNKRADELANKAMDARRNVEDAAGPMATTSVGEVQPPSATRTGRAKASLLGRAKAPVEVRSASDSDIPAVAELSRQFAAEDICWGMRGTSEGELAKRLAGLFLVAAHGEEIVGHAFGHVRDAKPGEMCVFPDGAKYLELEELYVASGRRGKGIGSALVEAIMAAARKQGAERVLVYSAIRDTERAMNFYRRHGLKVWYVQMFL
jgi:ribonuclease HI/GNAT superfamily N-acetyltransferase